MSKCAMTAEGKVYSMKPNILPNARVKVQLQVLTKLLYKRKHYHIYIYV